MVRRLGSVGRIAQDAQPHEQGEAGEGPPLERVGVVADVAVVDVRDVPLPPAKQHHHHAGREDEHMQRDPARCEGETEPAHHPSSVRQRAANSTRLAIPAAMQ